MCSLPYWVVRSWTSPPPLSSGRVRKKKSSNVAASSATWIDFLFSFSWCFLVVLFPFALRQRTATRHRRANPPLAFAFSSPYLGDYCVVLLFRPLSPLQPERKVVAVPWFWVARFLCRGPIAVDAFPRRLFFDKHASLRFLFGPLPRIESNRIGRPSRSTAFQLLSPTVEISSFYRIFFCLVVSIDRLY